MPLRMGANPVKCELALMKKKSYTIYNVQYSFNKII